MTADSGQSINMTDEASDSLRAEVEHGFVEPSPAIIFESTDHAKTPIPDPITPTPEIEVSEIIEVGKTPNPAQVLPSLGTLIYPDLPVPPMYGSHSTLLVDVLRRRRLRKIVLRRLSRKHLRAARAMDRRASHRLWITIASIVLALLIVFLSVGGAAGYVAYRFAHTTQTTYEQQVLTLHDLLPPDNLKIYDSKGVLI